MSKIIKEGKTPFDNGRDSQGKKWEDYDTIVCPDGEVIDMANLLQDQQRAMAALSHLVPAIGGFVSKLRPIYTFKVDTQATDGYNLFVNPQFTAHLDLTGKTFVLAHEIMHCLLNHLRRAQDLGHPIEKANIAADYECNITLVDNFELVKFDTVKKLNALIDKKYSGWGYEKIYADNPSTGGSGNMNNSDKASQAQGGSGNPTNQQFDPDYIKGWNQAVADYEAGKLKI